MHNRNALRSVNGSDSDSFRRRRGLTEKQDTTWTVRPATNKCKSSTVTEGSILSAQNTAFLMILFAAINCCPGRMYLFWPVSWGRPLLPEILGQPAPVGAKSPILNQYSLVAEQPQHLAKRSINTNRKFTTRFSMSLRWTSYVHYPESPQRGLTDAKRPFSIRKSRFAWRKSATKFLLWKQSAMRL